MAIGRISIFTLLVYNLMQLSEDIRLCFESGFCRSMVKDLIS